MGLVNTVVPLDQIEDETVQWCKEIMKHSPTALRFLKAAMNAILMAWSITTNGRRCYITLLHY